jgi:uncharacterized Tic20 family protein
MGRFQSREEYERWRATQRGDAPPPVAAEEYDAVPAEQDAAAPAEQVYDGPAPGSREFVDRSLRHAGLATEREKNLAMLCHLTALLGFLIPFGNIIGPLVPWMIGKGESEFVDEHGKASMNFQISLLLYFVGVAVLAAFIGPLAFILIIVAVIAALYGLVMIIVNAIKAHNGEDGAYALSTRFLR